MLLARHLSHVYKIISNCYFARLKNSSVRVKLVWFNSVRAWLSIFARDWLPFYLSYRTIVFQPNVVFNRYSPSRVSTCLRSFSSCRKKIKRCIPVDLDKKLNEQFAILLSFTAASNRCLNFQDSGVDSDTRQRWQTYTFPKGCTGR